MFPIYFVTWTTYGTWLPGDKRWWVNGAEVPGRDRLKPPDAVREQAARSRMRDRPVFLTAEQREIVDREVREAVDFRRWHLVALSVRSNHVHLVLHSCDVTPEEVMSKLKARASRKLNEDCEGRGFKIPLRWWTRHGISRYLNDESSLEAAVQYVVEGQDRKVSRDGVREQN